MEVTEYAEKQIKGKHIQLIGNKINSIIQSTCLAPSKWVTNKEQCQYDVNYLNKWIC